MKIILGSSSPRRKQVLEKMGIEFEIISPSIDEKVIRSTDYKELPLLVARAKAESLKSKILKPAIVIVADSVVVMKDMLFEKPESETQAKQFLRGYGESPVLIHSALVVFNTETGEMREAVETTTLYFKKFSERIIDDLVSHGEVLDGAGALIVSNPTIREHILHIEGEWESAMGLSAIRTKEFIDSLK